MTHKTPKIFSLNVGFAHALKLTFGASLIACLSLLSVPTAQAHRPTMTEAELKQWGYRDIETERTLKASSNVKLPYQKNSLAYPLELKKESDQFGPIMHQIQTFTDPAYYHGGIDIRGDMHQEIKAPVSGKIEAGYYAYTDYPDGRSVKKLLSLKDAIEKGAPRKGDKYFEVSVTDKFGYRFEFHHVDRHLLPESIVQKILSGGEVVEGEVVGHIIRWTGKLQGLDYHHLHYNVVSPDGVYVNPQFLSAAFLDKSPPKIRRVHAVTNRFCQGSLPKLGDISGETDGYFVIEAVDFINGLYYANPPTRLVVQFQGHAPFMYDYTQALITEKGTLPDLRDLYVHFYCNENDIKTPASGSFRFYIRVPVPAGFYGPVIIDAFDQAGNTSRKEITVRSRSI